jgi:hypothetical protein
LIATWYNFDDAIAIILRKVCKTVGWSFGEAWIPDNQENLLNQQLTKTRVLDCISSSVSNAIILFFSTLLKINTAINLIANSRQERFHVSLELFRQN